MSDAAFDDLAEQVDAHDMLREMLPAYNCDQCGRLWIFWKGYDADPTEYIPQ